MIKIKRFYTSIQESRKKRSVQQLKKNEFTRATIEAIEDTKPGSFSHKERKFLDEINLIRKEYETYQDNEPLDQREDIKFGADASIPVSEMYKRAASPMKWGMLMTNFVKHLKPDHVLELGTNLGISAAHIISGLKQNEKGHLITIEASPKLSGIARTKLQSLNYPHFEVKCGLFENELPDLLSHDKTLDLVFIDGHHDKDATAKYFDMIHPFLSDKAVVIFDDINWSDGMKDFWKEQVRDRRVSFSIDLKKWGISIISNKPISSKKRYISLEPFKQ